eukprot:13186939-Heterocapsa_arctica.AAC.1
MNGGIVQNVKPEDQDSTRSSAQHTHIRDGRSHTMTNMQTYEDQEYPGQKVRKEACDIMVENHKDKVFQKQEEYEAIRINKTRRMDKHNK